MVNHLMHVDDLVVMSPSARSMQMLLFHCDKCADLHDIIFNTKSQSVNVLSLNVLLCMLIKHVYCPLKC